MKRFHFSILRTLALSAFLFSASCTSDGEEAVEETEDENRIHERSDESSEEAALPNAEQAAADAATAGAEGVPAGGDGTVDQNWSGEVQKLPSEQQINSEENTVGSETPNTYAVAQAAVQPETPAADATAGAETEAPAAAAVAESTVPAATPALPSEAEAAAGDGIPTLADVVGDQDQAPADTVKKETGKKHKGKKSAKHSGKKKGRRASASITPTGDGKVYIVRPGDTLGSIAGMVYGSRARWKDLADKNNLTAKALIFAGDSITYTPDASTAAFESKWDGLNKATVSVSRGESLSSIAAKVMGNAAYWKMIWQWNQEAITDPNKIAIGQELKYVAPADLNAALSSGKNEPDAH